MPEPYIQSQTLWLQTASNAAAANNLTQNAVAGVKTYVTGFEVTGAGATGASVITVALQAGGVTVQSYQLAIPAGAAVGVSPLIVAFGVPLNFGYASAGLLVPSFGVGNTNASANLHGFFSQI